MNSTPPLLAASSGPRKFWIPGLFLLTLAGLWWSGSLARSLSATFLPHAFCFLGNPRLIWMHEISDLLIGLSYLAISTTLTILVIKARGEIPFSWMFLSFGAFIVACGATHFMDVVTLYIPVYWLAANVKVVTAVASLTTAFALPFLVPHILEVLRAARISEERRRELESAQTVLQGEITTQGQTLEQLANEIAARNRELEENRQRLFVTLKSIGDAVIVTDAQGSINFMNGVAEELTGWTLAEANGRELSLVFNIVNQYTRTAVENPFEIVRRTRSIAGLANHTLLIARSGREISIDDSGAPILDPEGELTGVILIFRDISDRQRVEEMRALLASIVDSSEDAIISRDLKGRVTSWNKGAERLYGYTREEALHAEPTLTIPPDLVSEALMHHEDLREGSRFKHWETLRKTKDGQMIDVSITIFPIYDYLGNLAGTASIARDITVRKQTEQALRTSEKLAATGRLAASIAHEINNPLEAVMNLLFLVDTATTGDPVVNGYVSKAQAELMRVSHIARQTLAFYRDTTRPVEVCIFETIDNIVGIYKRELQEKNITVDLALPRDLCVTGLPGELRQVFSNLIRNAIEAVPSGGEIRITGSRNANGTTRVSVIDSGPGIKPEHQSRIFDAFFTTKGSNGTGLGLWVSQGIIQKHGGAIQLTSPVSEGKGTEFTITLPEVPSLSRESA